MYDHFSILHISLIIVEAFLLLKRGQDGVIIGVINSLYPHLVHILETSFTNLKSRSFFLKN